MGKKGKRDEKRKRDSMMIEKETVSILTPTVLSRNKFLSVLANCIIEQTYLSRIKQWVIVSADKSWSQNDMNNTIQTIIREYTQLQNITIDAVHITHSLVIEKGWEIQTNQDNYENIGYLRNITNHIATSDYLVCMDDDDYYPPTRVETAVISLRNNRYFAAGCSNHIAYETDIKAIYQFRKFANNHTVNNSLAYKRQFLDSGAKYDSTKKHAEERSFLNDYKVDLIQLDPKKTVVQLIHSNNTYNKRQLIVHSEWSKTDNQNIRKISNNNTHFIPQKFIDKYNTILQISNTTQSEYDVVYYLGTNGNQWSPYDTNLGGSEQAVKYLVEYWTSLGLSVCVYGDFNPITIELTNRDTSNGNYVHYMNFKCSTEYNTLILWRNYGTHPLLSWPVKAKQIIVDIHDIVPLHPTCLNNIDKVTKFIARSNFHKDAIKHNNNTHSDQILQKLIVIPNGVRVSDFYLPNTNIERDQFRFCWTSCYTRGLAQILTFLWPFIKYHEPKASFHIYYGMKDVRDKQFKEHMKSLLNQPGVYDHGRQNLDTIIKEKHTSSFHLYFSKTSAETDCISIRESTCAGCIPILSDYNVFSERNGIHLPGDPDKPEDMKNVGIKIIEILKDDNKIQSIRNDMYGKEINWQDISQKWKQQINL